MSILENTKIRTKILSIIFVVCTVGLGAVLSLSTQFRSSDRAYFEFVSKDNRATLDLARANRSLSALAYTAYQVMAYDTQAEGYTLALNDYEPTKALLFKQFGDASSYVPKRSAQYAQFLPRIQAVVDLTDRAVAFASSSQDEQAKAALAAADALIMPLSDDLVDFNTVILAEIDREANALTDNTQTTIIVTLSAVAVTFILVITAAFVVSSRGITTPIIRLRERMLSLASGETSAEIDGMNRKDEVGEMAVAVQVFRENAIERIRLEQETEANRSLSERERIERDRQKAQDAADVQFAVDSLATALSKLSDGDVSYRIQQAFTRSLDTVRENFNASAEMLQSALLQVSQNARGIDAGANEIKSAANDLAKRTEQQAAGVEETAAALEEITTTVKDSTKRAQEAGELVKRARTGAEQSGEVVRRAVSAMEQISKSANEISNIIGVIDEIAFQTNLLALNAGVEAARAGEAGKGFAVVAQEVRELAQRSASAAKEIKLLITASNQHVHDGVQLVGDTGKALDVIVGEVQEINRHVVAIVESAQEQSTGLQQINTAVNQMDQDTQKNAAMVEESTAASHSLAREVTSLNQLLSQFKLGTGHDGSVSTSTGVAHKDVASPARALGRRLASAFAGNAAIDTSKDNWEEF